MHTGKKKIGKTLALFDKNIIVFHHDSHYPNRLNLNFTSSTLDNVDPHYPYSHTAPISEKTYQKI